RRRHTRSYGDWSSDVCSSDLLKLSIIPLCPLARSTRCPNTLFPSNLCRHQPQAAGGGLLARFARFVVLGVLVDVPQIKKIFAGQDRKSTRLNSSHRTISYAVF